MHVREQCIQQLIMVHSVPCADRGRKHKQQRERIGNAPVRRAPSMRPCSRRGIRGSRYLSTNGGGLQNSHNTGRLPGRVHVCVGDA
jgi:hypothetical protein